jgi:hypothetical protein
VNRLHHAYVGLLFAPEGKDGARTVTLVRHGVFEVRLWELASCRESVSRRDDDASTFWIELYRRDTRSPLDSCCCGDLDEAENVAEQLESSAMALHRSQVSSGPV